MVVCCWNAPLARFDRSAYTSESDWGRRSSETVNPAGFPWITTRELSVCATNCAASSATGPVGGVRSAGISDLPSTSTIRMGGTPPSRAYSFAPSPTTTIVSAPPRDKRAAAARARSAPPAASRAPGHPRDSAPPPDSLTLPPRPAAEHLSRDAAGIVNRVGRLDGRVAERDVRLRRARPVHEQEIGRDPCSGSGQGGARWRRTTPACERLSHEVLHLGVRDVPGHHEQRPDRPQALAGQTRSVRG